MLQAELEQFIIANKLSTEPHVVDTDKVSRDWPLAVFASSTSTILDRVFWLSDDQARSLLDAVDGIIANVKTITDVEGHVKEAWRDVRTRLMVNIERPDGDDVLGALAISAATEALSALMPTDEAREQELVEKLMKHYRARREMPENVNAKVDDMATKVLKLMEAAGRPEGLRKKWTKVHLYASKKTGSYALQGGGIDPYYITTMLYVDMLYYGTVLGIRESERKRYFRQFFKPAPVPVDDVDSSLELKRAVVGKNLNAIAGERDGYGTLVGSLVRAATYLNENIHKASATQIHHLQGRKRDIMEMLELEKDDRTESRKAIWDRLMVKSKRRPRDVGTRPDDRDVSVWLDHIEKLIRVYKMVGIEDILVADAQYVIRGLEKSGGRVSEHVNTSFRKEINGIRKNLNEGLAPQPLEDAWREISRLFRDSVVDSGADDNLIMDSEMITILSRITLGARMYLSTNSGGYLYNKLIRTKPSNLEIDDFTGAANNRPAGNTDGDVPYGEDSGGAPASADTTTDDETPVPVIRSDVERVLQMDEGAVGAPPERLREQNPTLEGFILQNGLSTEPFVEEIDKVSLVWPLDVFVNSMDAVPSTLERASRSQVEAFRKGVEHINTLLGDKIKVENHVLNKFREMRKNLGVYQTSVKDDDELFELVRHALVESAQALAPTTPQQVNEILEHYKTRKSTPENMNAKVADMTTRVLRLMEEAGRPVDLRKKWMRLRQYAGKKTKSYGLPPNTIDVKYIIQMMAVDMLYYRTVLGIRANEKKRYFPNVAKPAPIPANEVDSSVELEGVYNHVVRGLGSNHRLFLIKLRDAGEYIIKNMDKASDSQLSYLHEKGGVIMGIMDNARGIRRDPVVERSSEKIKHLWRKVVSDSKRYLYDGQMQKADHAGVAAWIRHIETLVRHASGWDLYMLIQNGGQEFNNIVSRPSERELAGAMDVVETELDDASDEFFSLQTESDNTPGGFLGSSTESNDTPGGSLGSSTEFNDTSDGSLGSSTEFNDTSEVGAGGDGFLDWLNKQGKEKMVESKGKEKVVYTGNTDQPASRPWTPVPDRYGASSSGSRSQPLLKKDTTPSRPGRPRSLPQKGAARPRPHPRPRPPPRGDLLGAAIEELANLEKVNEIQKSEINVFMREIKEDLKTREANHIPLGDMGNSIYNATRAVLGQTSANPQVAMEYVNGLLVNMTPDNVNDVILGILHIY